MFLTLTSILGNKISFQVSLIGAIREEDGSTWIHTLNSEISVKETREEIMKMLQGFATRQQFQMPPGLMLKPPE